MSEIHFSLYKKDYLFVKEFENIFNTTMALKFLTHVSLVLLFWHDDLVVCTESFDVNTIQWSEKTSIHN